MKEDRGRYMEIKEDRGQYFAVKLLSSIFFCLLLSTSNYPAKAQEAFCLDQTIRQAQDSTIMAFQSRHEYNYYRSITMSFRLCASVDLLYHPGSHFGCGHPAQCRQSRGGEERCGTPRSHARPASSPQVWHVGYHYIGENRQLNIVICKNLLAFANPL